MHAIGVNTSHVAGTQFDPLITQAYSPGHSIAVYYKQDVGAWQFDPLGTQNEGQFTLLKVVHENSEQVLPLIYSHSAI